MIKTYILTIISIVILSAIADALMPDTEIKKHINLVIGLIILLAIAKPLVSIPRFFVEDITLSLDYNVSQSSKKITKKIEESQFEIVNDTFKKSLEKSIENSIISQCGIQCKVDAYVNNGTVDKIKINLKENEKIQTFVKDTYGLSCVFEEN